MGTKTEQNKQNNNVFSKGVDETKNKDGILKGMTKDKEEKTNTKKEDFEERALGRQQTKKLKLQDTILCIMDKSTPFRHPFQQPLFWKGECTFGS